MIDKVVYPKSYVAWDLETTGLNPRDNDILEIGVMVIENGEKVLEKSWMLNHNIEIPDIITEITGINKEIVDRDGVDPSEAMREALTIMKFTDKNCPNLTHNGIKFDIDFFVNQAIKNLGFNYHQAEDLNSNIRNSAIDSAVLFKAMKLGMERMWNESFSQYADRVLSIMARGVKYNVGACCDDLEISREGVVQHRALADVYLTNEIYKRLVQQHG